jgi:membrane protease YdiL (CAAX protease family)
MSNASSKEPEVPAKADPSGVKWSPTAAIVVTVLAFFASQVVTALFLGIIGGSLGWDETQIELWFMSVSGQFIFVLVAEALTLGILWRFLKRRKASIRSLGFHRKPIPKDLLYILGGFFAYFALLIAATSLAGGVFNVNVEQEQDVGFKAVTSDLDRLMAFASLVILPPVVEEVVFRGFLYGGLRRRFGIWSATFITSAMFAAPSYCRMCSVTCGKRPATCGRALACTPLRTG